MIMNYGNISLVKNGFKRFRILYIYYEQCLGVKELIKNGTI